MIFYHFTPSWHIVFFPFFLIIAFVASFGIGLYLTTLNLKYRDFRIVVPFIVQFGFYLSPVGYSSTIVPEKWKLLYSLNPMVGVIDGFRWCIIGDQSNIYWTGFGVSLAVMVSFAIFALWHFRKTEKEFADYI
jgi:lipopolysaccharide transport system permease protein